MKPLLVSRAQIDDREWNSHIAGSPECAPYAFTFYLDIVCEDWQALVWPQTGDYELVMPFAVRKRLGMKVVYQPLFCQYLGIYSKTSVTAGQTEMFVRALSKCYSYISGYHFSPDNPCLPNEWNDVGRLNYRFSQTHILPLNKCSRPASAYSTDRRNNLKRGLRENWQLVESKNIHPLIYLFQENHAPGIGGVHYSAFERLDRLFTYLKQLDMADLMYAHLNGRIRAGIMVVKSPGKSVFLFNAADELGRRGNARTVLIDYYLREKQPDGAFDFESPGKKSVCDFYKSFGAETRPFLCISKNDLPFPFRQLQNWRKWWFSKPVDFLFKTFIRF